MRPFGPTTLQEQDLLVADLMSRETKEWNVARNNNLLPELTHLILQIRPSVMDTEDSFIWPLHTSRKYSTKSGYYSMIQSQILNSPSHPPVAHLDWKKLVWTPRLSPKLKMFLWKILHGALPTGENLQKRNLLANTVCATCGEHETTMHLFLHCRFAQ